MACRITGIEASAVSPSASSLTGISRQQSNCNCSCFKAERRVSSLTASSSTLPKIIPAARGWSSLICSRRSRKNARSSSCGRLAVIPAPSPLRPSAAIAPRCARRERASSPIWSTSKEGVAGIRVMKPTPQESCSNRGSYKPCCTFAALSEISQVTLRPRLLFRCIGGRLRVPIETSDSAHQESQWTA